MRTFSYRGYDAGGRAARGMLEALDLKDARERLSLRGVFAETIDAVGDRSGAMRFVRRVTAADRSRLYEELAALQKAGLTLSDSLEAVIRGTRHPAIPLLLASVRDRVREGQPFGDAMDSAGFVLSDYERALLDAGVRGGSLPECLERLASFFEGRHRASERLRSALVYPAIVLGLSLAIAAGMFGVVIPTISKLFTESRLDLPFLTTVLLGAGAWLGRWGGVVLLGLGLAAWLGARGVRRSAEARLAMSRRLFSLPVAGDVLCNLASARFAATLAMLLKGGVPLVEAFVLAGSSTGSRWVAELAREGAEAIRHGGPVSKAVAAIPPLADGLPEWIQAGEASGDLAGLLDKAAGRYELRWQNAMGRLVGLIEPALIILVGAFVLVVALAILLPILSLNRTLM